MLVAALLRRVHIPVDVDGLLLDGLLIHVEELHLFPRHADDLLVLDKDHVPGVLQHSRHIGSDDAAVLRVSHDEGTVLADRVELIRVVTENDAEGVGSLHPVHDLGDGPQGIPVIVVVQKLGDDLRVRLRDEGIPLLLQLLLQLDIVLDDAVVHHRDGPARVKMGVGVHIRGRPVGGPPGMPDPQGAGQHLPAVAHLIEYFQPAPSPSWR